jgi:hypothetical protein
VVAAVVCVTLVTVAAILASELAARAERESDVGGLLVVMLLATLGGLALIVTLS